NGCTATDVALVTLNNTPPNANAGADAQILCGAGAVVLNGSSSTAGATFAWVASNGGHIVSGANTATPTVDTAGTYTLTVTNPVNGCTNTDIAEVTVQICSAALCSYTQGYYGNEGGMSCAPDGQGGFASYTTAELIAKALASYGGTMTIGLPGHSVWMMSPDDIDDIIRVLPGGGMSKVLAPFDYQISNLPPNYLKNGVINNTLLAQTITLGLNLGVNGQLGNFELQAGTLATATSEGGCGSDVAKVRSCNPDGTVNNEYEYYTIPSGVVNALGGNPTVQGLFALANQALGGGDTYGLSLSAIADVVDKINNAFDGCRIPVGYGISPLVCPVIETTTFSAMMTSDAASFDAYPVPFKDQLTIKYNFDYISDVKIEVFDSKGVLVYSMIDTGSYLGKEVAVSFSSFLEQQQVYVVKLTTSLGSSTKTVMSSY
uniref:hypothetical protein n=1 Tax=Flavobacterium daejeonense TaxID=350893 RepID=UPI000558FCDF